MLRDVIRGITTILFVAVSLINIRLYARLRGNFYYRYSLGLMLFAAGVVFVSQGDIQSPIFWLGRLSHYICGLYFPGAILGAYWLTRTRNRGLRPDG